MEPSGEDGMAGEFLRVAGEGRENLLGDILGAALKGAKKDE